jgi:hypothetical protein
MKYRKEQDREIKAYLSKANCQRFLYKTDLTLDHIIPVSFLTQQLGATVEETFDWDNFQALCRRCNTLKAGRFDLSNVKTKPLLLKYVNQYCK